jgi:hypothetical protein
MPQFISEKGISRLPLLVMIGFNLVELYLCQPYPDASTIAKFMKMDIKSTRDAIKWCVHRNFVLAAKQGYRGRSKDGKFGSQRYYLTLIGQEVLNQYHLHCHY